MDSDKSVTICIVNYRTEELTRLALRSIRKFTNCPYQVIVVDNDSGDGSLEYLRSLKWIQLIERPGQVMKSGSWAHGTALDLGLAACDTPYFCSLHSDTIVHKEGWLNYLVDIAEKKPDPVCVGCGKLDLKPQWLVLLKKFTDVKAWIRNLDPETKRKSKFYIRTICALYKTKVLKDEKLGFSSGVESGFTCGKQLYFDLVEKGYPTHPVAPDKMATYIHHMAHATMVLNPEFSVRSRTKVKCRRQLQAILSSPQIQSILSDTSLDL